MSIGILIKIWRDVSKILREGIWILINGCLFKSKILIKYFIHNAF